MRVAIAQHFGCGGDDGDAVLHFLEQVYAVLGIMGGVLAGTLHVWIINRFACYMRAVNVTILQRAEFR